MKSHAIFKKRLERLQAKLAHWEVEACLVENPIDLFYLTGLKLSVGRLIVTNKEARLFVDGRYAQIAREKAPIDVYLFEEENVLNFKKIAFDSSSTVYDHYLKLKERYGNSLKPVPYLLRELRLIKDAKELIALRRSAALLWKGFQHIRKCMRSGITEHALALELEFFCKKRGASTLSFDPIIAFGANSAMPHYRAGDKTLKKGDIVLVDIGIVVDGYCSDMTRTFFWGKPEPRLKELYDVVRAAHKAALGMCRPGIAVGKIDEAARAEMRKTGLEKLFIHSLGHAVGLEVHEYPIIKFNNADKDQLLKAGMVITIEPGLYLPGVGGVRYEDTIIITAKGYRNLYPQAGAL